MSPPDPIQRVLVANRGEIAERVFRTCRRLGIATVAVHSDPDETAPFVREADDAVALGGRTPTESYLRGEAIIEAAKRTCADAIHPGYGFLAENAHFARAVVDAGLTWIGPSPDVISAMGSKTAARERMEAAGVPVLPGCHLTDEAGDALLRAGEAVGYPLLVKASAGGGGKGMRTVAEPKALAAAVDAARGEAARAFGDATVFLERLATEARHVEVQIMGDQHGTVAALLERDCSVQRRHQKVVEECPSPAVDDVIRKRMSAAAVAAGQALGYVGAGTVEFLLTQDGSFYFLEVNTRLQVEHPVTEMVTGLDLVELQILAAEGARLPLNALEPSIDGHAVEVRLYAEDALNDFLPQTGTLSRFVLEGDVRVDSGVREGSTVSPYYDPLLAKVVAHGPTRDAALRKLADALARAQLHGTITNRDLLVRILRHPDFRNGQADTGFLERQDLERLAAPLLDNEQMRTAAAAAVLAGQAARRASARVLADLPSGWRNTRWSPQRETVSAGNAKLETEYSVGRDGRLSLLRVDGQELESARLLASATDRIELEIAGRRHTGVVHDDGERVYVNLPTGQAEFVRVPRFVDLASGPQAGSLSSPMPGTVIRVMVEEGAEVAEGQALLVIEAMKMEHEIVAPSAGSLVELRARQGGQVQTGQILAVIDDTL